MISNRATWQKTTCSQFHQHFLQAAFTHADPYSAKKDSQVKQLFVLSGSVGIKAARKHVDEIDPWLKPYAGLGAHSWLLVDD